MAVQSGAGEKALASIGIQTNQLADDMRTKGLIPALEDLKQHLKDSGDTASQQAAIVTDAFGRRQATGILLLLGQLDRLKASEGQVGAGARNEAKDVAAYHQTLAYQFDRVKATMQELVDKLGMALIPVLGRVAHAVADVVGWFQKHTDVAKTLAEIMAIPGGIMARLLGKLDGEIRSQSPLKERACLLITINNNRYASLFGCSTLIIS